MKLVGELKEEVEKIETKEGKKEAIKKAGMELSDEELDQVTGGRRIIVYPIKGNGPTSKTFDYSNCTCDNPLSEKVWDVNGYYVNKCKNCGGFINVL